MFGHACVMIEAKAAALTVDVEGRSGVDVELGSVGGMGNRIDSDC